MAEIQEVTVQDALLRTRECIERGWTQCRSARNEAGDSVSINDGAAVAWCLAGAIDYITYGDLYYPLYDATFAVLRKFVGSKQGVIDWNDAPGRTKEEVLDLLDQALLSLQ